MSDQKPCAPAVVHPVTDETVWARMRCEAGRQAETEPALASFLHATILNHDTFCQALSYRLAQKLSDHEMNALQWREVASAAYADAPEIIEAARLDILAIFERDPACKTLSQPFLYFKGFHALQSYRVAHWLIAQGREPLAHYLQSRMSELFAIDINPAAEIGHGLFIDHGHGIVIGETARVGNNVSLLHGVTLGGTGKQSEDRHPKVQDGVMIGAGAKILGNILVGKGAKIAAGSVVLAPIKAGCTVAGVPAKPVGECAGMPAREMDQNI